MLQSTDPTIALLSTVTKVQIKNVVKRIKQNQGISELPSSSSNVITSGALHTIDTVKRAVDHSNNGSSSNPNESVSDSNFRSIRYWAWYLLKPYRGKKLPPDHPDINRIQTALVTWLIDCYRMRVHDDLQWCGGLMRGCYHPDQTAASVCIDFLLFLKLATKRGALAFNRSKDFSFHCQEPLELDFQLCLNTAAELLPSRFQKEHAKVKYGTEDSLNYDSNGGIPSLRTTAEIIYMSTIMWYAKELEKKKEDQVPGIQAEIGRGYRDLLHDYSERQGYSKEVTELFVETIAQVGISLGGGLDSSCLGPLIEVENVSSSMIPKEDKDIFFASIGGIKIWKRFLKEQLTVALQLSASSSGLGPLRVIAEQTKIQATVLIFGMKRAGAQYNGVVGQLLTNSLDEKGCLNVALSNGKSIQIKPENLRLLVDTLDDNGVNTSTFSQMIQKEYEKNTRNVTAREAATEEAINQQRLVDSRRNIDSLNRDESILVNAAWRKYSFAYKKFQECNPVNIALRGISNENERNLLEKVLKICKEIQAGNCRIESTEEVQISSLASHSLQQGMSSSIGGLMERLEDSDNEVVQEIHDSDNSPTNSLPSKMNEESLDELDLSAPTFFDTENFELNREVI